MLIFVFKSLYFLLRVRLNTWAVPTLQDHRSNYGTTNQSTPIAINPTLNDSNIVGIQIIDRGASSEKNRPTHGTLSQNPAGQIIDQPTGTYIGTDSSVCAKGDRFIYIGYNSEGSISKQSTVNITITNQPPTIESISIPTNITEGQTIQLSAVGKDTNSNENQEFFD
jgi:hypothetical protein